VTGQSIDASIQHRTPSLDMLLTLLKERAGRDRAEAFALEPQLYLSEELLALERERIFSKEWHCAGRADEIPEPGDYLTFQLSEQGVVIIRQRDARLRAFSNVCLHRMMVLVEGTGSCKRISCPYHAWTYDIDGRLVAAPQMNRTAGFDRSAWRLPEVRCEEWEGWIYLTANPDATPVAERLGPLQELTARYQMSDYVHVVRQDAEWNTNWKLLTENFMESYHLSIVHRRTFGQWFPTDETRFPDEEFDAFAYQTFIKNEDATYGVAHPSNERLTGRWRQTTVMPTVFPAHMYVLAPDHLWYLSLQPRATDRVGIRFGVALAPEVIDSLEDRDAFVADLMNFFDQANAEDRAVVEGIQQGIRGPLASAGPLSWLEREIHDFTRYLARRLTGQA